MSNSNSTVGFEFISCTPEDQGSLWFAFGTNVPSAYQHALFYTFNFQNNTTSTSFDYDVSTLLEGEYVQSSGINLSGSESGTVSPGETATVMIYRASNSEKDSDNNCLSIQIGAAPLIASLNGSTVCFWFSDDGGLQIHHLKWNANILFLLLLFSKQHVQLL